MPQPTKLQDYVGKTVVLIRDVETIGGKRFPAGTEFQVDSTWRGTLMLSGKTGALRKVSPRTVRVPQPDDQDNPYHF